jgi:hypothetical protein
LRADDARVVASRRWLEENFSASTNPGTFESVREVDRDATYFYYAWSVAHAFRALGIDQIVQNGRRLAWAETLARELLRRQTSDGTWSNRFTASKEDDPLVATSFATGALGNCRLLSHQVRLNLTDNPAATRNLFRECGYGSWKRAGWSDADWVRVDSGLQKRRLK